ncbi:MAG: hypothetical protein PF485_10435 [Bacteroidales bacterium]|jgi:uncharacterized membrane protein|nr:hypothetical protein [Bacteroidales bacterium]
METIESLHDLRSTAGSAYSLGWKKMFKYFLYAFLVIVFLGIISAPVGWTYEIEHIHLPVMFNFFSIFTIAYFFFLVAPLKYGAKKVLLNIIRGGEIDIKELFYGFKDYLNIVLANLLMTALIGIGMIFLIVPGIILACRLAFVPYLVVDKKLDAVKAVEESWRMTRGHGWTIFLMALMVIPIGIAGLAVLGVGVIFSIIWVNIAFAAIYAIVIAKKEIPDSNL